MQAADDFSWFLLFNLFKILHRINVVSLEFCLQGCFCFVPNIQNKNLEKKQSKQYSHSWKDGRTPDREQLLECNDIQYTSLEQHKGSLMSAYHSFSISKALRSAVEKVA